MFHVTQLAGRLLSYECTLQNAFHHCLHVKTRFSKPYCTNRVKTPLIIAPSCRGTVCDILITSPSYLTSLYLSNPKPAQLSCYSD